MTFYVNLKNSFFSIYNLFIKTYFSERHFKIRYELGLSGIAVINARVPQQGVLFYFLYSIIVFDQPTTPNITLTDFADNKVIISINYNPLIALTFFLICLNRIKNWLIK